MSISYHSEIKFLWLPKKINGKIEWLKKVYHYYEVHFIKGFTYRANEKYVIYEEKDK